MNTVSFVWFLFLVLHRVSSFTYANGDQYHHFKVHESVKQFYIRSLGGSDGKHRQETEISDYDFVIDIENLLDIQKGWPVNVRNDEVYERLFEESETDRSELAVVGLLGYYSKGKTFIMNGLYNMVSAEATMFPSVLICGIRGFNLFGFFFHNAKPPF